MGAGIQDFNLDWKRKRIWIPAALHHITVPLVADFEESIADDTGIMKISATGVAQVDAADNADETMIPTVLAADAAQYGIHLTSPLTGAAKMVLIGGLGLPGFDCKAGDLLDYTGLIPFDLDVTRPVGVRVVYTHGSATAADTVTWIVLHNSGIAPAVVWAAPATALNTVIGAQTLAGAAANQIWRGNRGIINADTFVEADYVWAFRTEMDATDVDTTAEGVFFLGLEIDYVPSLTYGRRANRDRRLTTNVLGTVES